MNAAPVLLAGILAVSGCTVPGADTTTYVLDGNPLDPLQNSIQPSACDAVFAAKYENVTVTCELTNVDLQAKTFDCACTGGKT